MYRVFADKRRLELHPWNAGSGNKILHLLFVCSLCERHDRQPALPCTSDLGDLFDLSAWELDPDAQPTLAFVEKSAFPAPLPRPFEAVARATRLTRQRIPRTIANSRREFERANAFLRGPMPPGDIAVRGHFWHFPLMPSAQARKHWLPIQPALSEQVRHLYPGIELSNSVAVHLRETDFRQHLRHIFPGSICLPTHYYRRAMELVERALGHDVIYFVFSDNKELAEALFAKKRYFIRHGASGLERGNGDGPHFLVILPSRNQRLAPSR
jgi:hypothetical protein